MVDKNEFENSLYTGSCLASFSDSLHSSDSDVVSVFRSLHEPGAVSQTGAQGFRLATLDCCYSPVNSFLVKPGANFTLEVDTTVYILNSTLINPQHFRVPDSREDVCITKSCKPNTPGFAQRDVPVTSHSLHG